MVVVAKKKNNTFLTFLTIEENRPLFYGFLEYD